ncbi:hypothetical protein V491_02307, partial [Pseudogymnoascus sp. VKM F-3775]
LGSCTSELERQEVNYHQVSGHLCEYLIPTNLGADRHGAAHLDHAVDVGASDPGVQPVSDHERHGAAEQHTCVAYLGRPKDACTACAHRDAVPDGGGDAPTGDAH